MNDSDADRSPRPVGRSEAPERLIDDLQTQAVRLEEQAAELQMLNDELSASEARLQGVIDSALDAIITSDSDNRVLDWSRHAEEMFGWTPEDARGQDVIELIFPPRHHEAHRSVVKRFLDTRDSRVLRRRFQTAAIRRTREEFSAELSVTATGWGAEVVFATFVRDLTEEKDRERIRAARTGVTHLLAHAETTAEAMPRIIATLCENLGCEAGTFWTLDPDRDRLTMAERWVDPAFDVPSPDEDAPTICLAVGEGLAGRALRERAIVTARVAAADPGTAATLEEHVSGRCAGVAVPVQIAERIFGVIELLSSRKANLQPPLLEMLSGVAADVAQFLSRREAEEQLEKRSNWQQFLVKAGATLAAAGPDYRATLEQLAHLTVPELADWCSVYTVDAGGEVRRVVMVHTRSQEADAAEGIAMEGDRLTKRHPATRVIDTGEPLLVTHSPGEILESTAANAEELERLRQLDITSGMIVPLTARGRALGAVLLLSLDPSRVFREHDLEAAMEFADRAAMFLDNARLYREAQVANASKADFLATMSHELRTPLNAVLGYADLLMQGIPESITPPVEKYVRRISFSAHHLLQLIEEILTYSRLEAGRESVILERVDVETIAEEVRAIMEPLAKEKPVELIIDVQVAHEPIMSDPRKMRQMLLNLLSNAVKFTSEGEVELTASVQDEELVLAVRDTGIGMAPEHLDRIFEPFWQVEQTNTRTVHGTGLGLSVTSRFVKLLGGSITAESEPGKGSRFEIRLPVDGGPAGRQRQDASERRVGSSV